MLFKHDLNHFVNVLKKRRIFRDSFRLGKYCFNSNYYLSFMHEVFINYEFIMVSIDEEFLL